MKYLIVKGALGFGDRLQSLKMCVKYAQKHNLIIYVDWTDPIWSHNGESFYTYFKLLMPSLNSLDDIPEDATVFPAIWKTNMKKNVVDLITSNREIDLGYIQDKVFSADVLVYACSGLRYIYGDSTFFTNVFRVIDPRIIQKVKSRQQTHQLASKIGIHLRGTDRTTKISKTHRMAGMNIRMVASGLLNGTKFIAVSDDPEFINIWKAKYREFPVLTEVGNLGGKEGVHNKSKESLGVSKDMLNVDLLCDFFTLASCRGIISTAKDSRFGQEAGRMHKAVNQILQ
jgi:hypothetical protein